MYSFMFTNVAPPAVQLAPGGQYMVAEEGQPVHLQTAFWPIGQNILVFWHSRSPLAAQFNWKEAASCAKTSLYWNWSWPPPPMLTLHIELVVQYMLTFLQQRSPPVHRRSLSVSIKFLHPSCPLQYFIALAVPSNSSIINILINFIVLKYHETELVTKPITKSVTEIPKVGSVQSGRPRHNTPSTRAFCVSCVLVHKYTRISVTLEEAYP